MLTQRLLFMKCAVLAILFCAWSSFLIACTEPEPLPESITVDGDLVTFKLENKDYHRVSLVSDIINVESWRALPMEYHDSTWVITMMNPHRKVQYVFQADEEDMLDPLNPKVIKVNDGNRSEVMLP